MEIKNRYDLTEVGVIPIEWEIAVLRKLASKVIDNRGKTPPLSSEGYPLIEVEAIFGDNKYPDYNKVDKFVTKETYNNWFRGHPKKGDLLLATVGSVGASSLMDQSIGCIAQNIVGLSFSDNQDSNYYYYVSTFTFFKTQVRSVVMGAVQPSLKLPHLLDIKIPVPSLVEQIAIATALSDIDSLITSLENLIDKKQKIKQGIMQQLLTGKKRLPGFSREWETKKLDDLTNILKGRGLSKSILDDNGTNKCILYGELFTKYDQVINSVVSRTSIKEGVRSYYGDVVMPGSTTTVGKDLAIASALMLDDILLGGDVIIIRKKYDEAYDSIFLSHYLTQVKKQDIANVAQGITIIHLYGSMLVNIAITIPSNIVEQNAIAQVITDKDSEIQALERNLSKYRLIKQGMMQELLTGRKRLI